MKTASAPVLASVLAPLVLALAAPAALAGKSAKAAKGPPPFSGFLRDYDGLEPTKESGRKNLLRYLKPGLSLEGYHSIVIEPVEVWFEPDVGVVGVQPDSLKEMTDYFVEALRSRALRDLQLVNQPGPGVLRLRLAITELVPVKKKRNVLSLSPTGFLAESAKRGIKGAQVAQVSVEGELLDSASGERLAAIVERRLGKKAYKLEESPGTDHVRKVIDFWADRFEERLDELRSGKGQG